MNSNDSDAMLEHKLSGQFARMRKEDSVDLPPFPDYVQQTASDDSDFAPGPRTILLRISLAAGVLLAVGLLVTGQAPSEDPAVVYAEVMGNYALETDELLTVSDSISPEMTGLPELMQSGFPGDIEPLAN